MGNAFILSKYLTAINNTKRCGNNNNNNSNNLSTKSEATNQHVATREHLSLSEIG